MRGEPRPVPAKRKRFSHMADEYDLFQGDEYRWVAAELRRQLHPRLRKADLADLNRGRS